MKCTNRPAHLVDFAQGIASPEARAQIAGHVNNCPICSKEVTELNAIFASMKTRRLTSPPETYWTNLVPRIHERLGERTPSKRFLKGAPVFLPAAVIMLLAIFITRFDIIAPMYEVQDIRSLLHQMADEMLQEVDQSVAIEESAWPGRLSPAVDDPAGTDKEILLAIFEDGEPTEGYSDLDQVQPETSITEDEAGDVVALLQSHI